MLSLSQLQGRSEILEQSWQPITGNITEVEGLDVVLHRVWLCVIQTGHVVHFGLCRVLCEDANGL